MSKFIKVLVVDSVCLISVVVRGLYTKLSKVSYVSGINSYFIPSNTAAINTLSPAIKLNITSINLSLCAVSTGPIRTITKYLNI